MKFKIISGIVAVAVVATAFSVYYQRANAHRRLVQQAQVHLEKGIELYHKKDYVHAQVELRKSLRTYPGQWKSYFYMSSVMVRQKRYALAIPYLERALSLNPWDTKILNAFGVVYFKLGRLDMARGYFTAALTVDSSDRQAKNFMEIMAKLERRSRQAASPAEGQGKGEQLFTPAHPPTIPHGQGGKR